MIKKLLLLLILSFIFLHCGKEDNTGNTNDDNMSMVIDANMGYRKMQPIYRHQSTKHGQGEYVKGDVHTNGIESFWSIFKRGYIRVYHYMSKKHLQRYVDEFVFRYNNQKSTISDMVILSEHKRLLYGDLICG